MKSQDCQSLIFLIAVSGVVCLVAKPSISRAETFGEQFLRYFPRADLDGDGVLSEKEEAAVSKRVIQRFPKVDTDGDGLLSTSEKTQLLKKVALMRGRADDGPAVGGFFGGENSTNNQSPSFAEVRYGEDERNVFDIWLANSETPTPLAVYIHGGGFKSGSKEKLQKETLTELLDSGISVAAINYRLVTTDPLPTAHHDARRAIQFMRSKAADWNIDKNRVAAFGGSAGAQICMWLAFSDDMANAASNDPIERESTRLLCVATAGGQTSNESEFYMEKILPLLGGQAKDETLVTLLSGGRDFEKVKIGMWGGTTLEAANETARQCSALRLISSDDPPIFMRYGMAPDAEMPKDMSRLRGWLIHHVVFGVSLKERADELDVEADLFYPGSNSKYSSEAAFFREKLR